MEPHEIQARLSAMQALLNELAEDLHRDGVINTDHKNALNLPKFGEIDKFLAAIWRDFQ